MAGASAGSIIAVCHHSGLSTDVIAAGCLELAEDCRKNGTRGRLGVELLYPLRHHPGPEQEHHAMTGIESSKKTQIDLAGTLQNFFNSWKAEPIGKIS